MGTRLTLQGVTFTNPALPVLPSGILDRIGGAAVAWSTRRLSMAYDGPLARIFRDSDSAEMDVKWAAGSRKIDRDAIIAFANNNTSTVRLKVLYDQTGNGRHLRAISSNGVPVFSSPYSVPTVLTSGNANSDIALSLDGTKLYQADKGAFILAAPAVTLFSVVRGSSATSQARIVHEGSSTNASTSWDVTQSTVNTSVRVRNDAGTLQRDTNPIQTPTIDSNASASLLVRDTGTSIIHQINGGAFGTDSSAPAVTRSGSYAAANQLSIGAASANAVTNAWWVGRIAQMVIWTKDLSSAERLSVLQDAHGHYDIPALPA